MKSNLTAKEIRKEFLTFFESKNHKIVPSAPVVLKDDPTLLFVNAGMNQFKDFFLGNKKAVDTKVADTQKCLRVSGKHNDLEEVGVDTYHHTLFEMLGNWSFGDYFKEESIAWAWELLTEVFKIDKDRLYVSVFEGDKTDGLKMDSEAKEIWKKYIAEDRILEFDKKDNFWEMGETGPCGPCSEIHIDLRSNEERAKQSGASLVNLDHEQVIEIWNLVFMQYNRKADGSLELLPEQHVDTGMGFERLVRAVQLKQSNYDTDVFTPYLKALEKLSGKKYGLKENTDIAFRVIADHIRAVSFAIADGQLPSNNGAGYVIRRILRRAVRYGYTFLGFENAFFYKLVAVLVSEMGEVFPEVKKQQEFLVNVIKEEEISFFKTLSIGISKLEQIKNSNAKAIDGKTAFELSDTYGFPLDLTQLIASEYNMLVDVEAYNAELAKQKERSRSAEDASQGDWIEVSNDKVEEFVGYDLMQSEIKISRYREVEKKGKKLYHLVFNYTPFYAESGGQVGDKGFIEDAEGNKTFIEDTQKENDLTIHIVKQFPKNIKSSFKAVVNENRRKDTEKNHSATHLLQHVLRNHIGKHVEQRGSLVNENYLRFDFSHFQKLSDEEIETLEQTVNALILENIVLNEKRNLPITDAKAMGAMALFGEKYGDVVRVIKFGDSVEFCGGTHVKATGEIGLFKIISESSIASGVRRIEALTGKKAFEYLSNKEKELKAIQDVIKAPKKTLEAVEKLQNENAALNKKLEVFALIREKQIKEELLDNVSEQQNGVNLLVKKINIDSAESLKNLTFQLSKEIENIFLVLASEINGKPMLSVALGEKPMKEMDLHAGKIIKAIAQEIKGGGGGQPFYASAGGKDVKGIDKALEKALMIFEQA
ncbi:MAG: alanine--tRNA ligase [Chitinophagales bacterium]